MTSFTARTDRALVPTGKPATRYLLVQVNAPQAPTGQRRTPANVSLVLDRSGSMYEDRKFTLARQALTQALGMLRTQDCFSVVVYDNEVDVLAASTLATDAAKQQALHALDAVEPRGATDLGAGWLRGCEQLANHLVREDRVSRCLLLTDGLANRGMQDHAELAVHAAELYRRGVATSTFGVGDDFDERLLRDMAHEGGGNFYFIGSADEIPRTLTSELGDAIDVTVRNAVLEVALPRGADVELLSRFRHRRAHGDNELRVELGDLVSEQRLAIVLKLTFPTADIGTRATVGVALTGRGLTSSAADVTWTSVTEAEDEAQPRDRDVDHEVARLYAALARADALEAHRAGDLAGAAERLTRVAAKITSYAGDDMVLRGVASDLGGHVSEFTRSMEPDRMKAHFFAAHTAMHFRDGSGQPIKGPDSKR